jgi:hypothetical protein
MKEKDKLKKLLFMLETFLVEHAKETDFPNRCVQWL